MELSLQTELFIFLTKEGVKLPKWVKPRSIQSRTVKDSDKLRSNQKEETDNSNEKESVGEELDSENKSDQTDKTQTDSGSSEEKRKV